MTALSEFKAAMKPGAVIEVTNHYVTREDHPSFGTTSRTVAKVNSASMYTSASPWPMKWPKASQIKSTDSGAWQWFGGGAGQGPDDLFLTVRVVES